MCDTFVAMTPATADGAVIFAKNSDRPQNEGQSICRYPGSNHGLGAKVRCTYIEIPQAEVTFEVLLSQPDWMWGAEMGTNEHGVVIGNEAVWTREDFGPQALLGMDLVRLGLERGTTSLAALNVITGLLERHGQGGACAEGDASFSYHNSFLVADAQAAWVLETAGQCWAAEKVTSGTRNISNGLSIRTDFDLASANLVEYATRKDYHSGSGAFDFAAAFSLGGVDESPFSRHASGRRLLSEHDGRISPETMMDILRDHDSGICMHGEFATTASMVSQLWRDGRNWHWMTGAPHPCRSPFQPMHFSEPSPAVARANPD